MHHKMSALTYVQLALYVCILYVSPHMHQKSALSSCTCSNIHTHKTNMHKCIMQETFIMKLTPGGICIGLVHLYTAGG